VSGAGRGYRAPGHPPPAAVGLCAASVPGQTPSGNGSPGRRPPPGSGRASGAAGDVAGPRACSEAQVSVKRPRPLAAPAGAAGTRRAVPGGGQGRARSPEAGAGSRSGAGIGSLRPSSAALSAGPLTPSRTWGGWRRAARLGRELGNKAGEGAEGAGAAPAGEEEAEGRPSRCLQLPEKRVRGGEVGLCSPVTATG